MQGVLYVRPIFTNIFLEPSVVNFINIKFYVEPFSGSRLKDETLPLYTNKVTMIRVFCVVLRVSLLIPLHNLQLLTDFPEIFYERFTVGDHRNAILYLQ